MPSEVPTNGDLATLMQSTAPGETVVQRALRAVRLHLGLDVAYVSEFVRDRTIFRDVDAPGLETLAKIGDSHSLDDVYCRHILAGRMPELIPDTAANPLAASLPITGAIPIGCHVSVPIRLADGEPYGMFCCIGMSADPSLGERDLQMMRAFAELAAFEIGRDRAATRAADARRARIEAMLAEDRFTMHYQPVVDLATGAATGFECLARFVADPYRSPDRWFAEAAEFGLGPALEIAAIECGLSGFAAIAAPAYLAVNVSPETILCGGLEPVLARFPVDRIVLEITEHALITDYERMAGTLRDMRRAGLRLAIDDAGAGYSSLNHILALQPDVIKLDLALIRNIDTDRARQALTAAMATFAHDTGGTLIAEGVETAAELATLRRLGVQHAQGYHLGRPAPLAAAVAMLADHGDRQPRAA